ncbi:MAG: hypothetical protein HY744_20365, partial [Deltaproteobacteria bacterium]|nr:hypothetical protein [Deltaproteobacteria bacterium]
MKGARSMEPTNLTVEILKDIRTEIRSTREELSTRLDATNQRLDQLARRQVEAEVRMSTEIVAVAGAVREVRDLLRDNLELRPRVDDHERRIRA